MKWRWSLRCVTTLVWVEHCSGSIHAHTRFILYMKAVFEWRCLFPQWHFESLLAALYWNSLMQICLSERLLLNLFRNYKTKRKWDSYEDFRRQLNVLGVLSCVQIIFRPCSLPILILVLTKDCDDLDETKQDLWPSEKRCCMTVSSASLLSRFKMVIIVQYATSVSLWEGMVLFFFFHQRSPIK